jgi:hypothetical protein
MGVFATVWVRTAIGFSFVDSVVDTNPNFNLFDLTFRIMVTRWIRLPWAGGQGKSTKV